MEKTFNVNGSDYKVKDFVHHGDSVSFSIDGRAYTFKLVHRENSELIIEGAERFKAYTGTPNREGESIIVANGREALVSALGKKIKKAASHEGGLISPMPGRIFKIVKTAGSEVKKGETILILEAMKMEHSIRSDRDGIIKKIKYQVGELVQGGVVLAELE